MRVLPIERIPKDLWDGKLLRIPVILAAAYEQELVERELLHQAKDSDNRHAKGGESLEDARIHFATRYCNSVGRFIYALCGPCKDFEPVSDLLLTVFSYGRVAVLDAPCGTGALSAALITTLTHLRKSGALPNFPLTISICGGDYSEPSKEIFRAMLGRITKDAASVGISVHFADHHWDAYNDQDTARLVDSWFQIDKSASDHVVGVLNFSGELHDGKKFRAFEPVIRQINGKLYDKTGAVVWIEPARITKSRTLWRHVKDMFQHLPWMAHLNPSKKDGEAPTALFIVEHPLTRTLMDSGVVLHMFGKPTSDL